MLLSNYKNQPLYGFQSKKSKELNLYLNPRKKSYIQLFSHYQIYFNQQNHSLDMLIQPNI